MKKVIVMLACVLAIGAASAQENKTQKFELGANVGITTFNNYSALSLFQDAADSYSNWSESIHFGYRMDNTMYGLKFGYSLFSTSAVAVNERCNQLNFGVMLRRYAKINNRFEGLFGLGFNATYWGNTFSYLGDDYSRSRWGMDAEFEIGLNYVLEDGNYFGVRAGYTVSGSTFKKDLDLPTGLNANDKRTYGGYTLSLQYGIRF